MPNNNDFIAKAKSQGYTDEQIRQYQILKQSGQLPVKMPVVNNTISQVDTDAALHSQGILQDFVGSGWNAAAYRDWETDRKSTRLNSSHRSLSRMPSSA